MPKLSAMAEQERRGRKPGTSQAYETIVNKETVALGTKFTALKGDKWKYHHFYPRKVYPNVLTRITNGQLPITEETRELFSRLAQIMGVSVVAFEPELTAAIRACAAMANDPSSDATVAVEFSDAYYEVKENRIPDRWESIQVYRPLNGPVNGVKSSFIYTGADHPERLDIRRGGRPKGPPKLALTGFRYYWIDFERDIEPDETHLVHEVVTYPGATEVPEPFLTSSVQEPVASCERMIVRVLFHPLAVPARIFHCEGPTHLMGVFDEPGGPEVQIRPGQRYFEREVPEPRPLRHYGFRWEWDDQREIHP